MITTESPPQLKNIVYVNYVHALWYNNDSLITKIDHFEGLVISSMARLSKRIQQKITKPVETSTKKGRPGRDFWLIAIICLNLFILALGWSALDTPSLIMYVLLALSLISIYVRKHVNIPEKFGPYLDKAGLVTIGAACILFAYICYVKFIS